MAPAVWAVVMRVGPGTVVDPELSVVVRAVRAGAGTTLAVDQALAGL